MRLYYLVHDVETFTWITVLVRTFHHSCRDVLVDFSCNNRFIFQEDRKQLHKKMKSQKIKEKYKKIDKEVKLKKKKIM